MQGITTLARLSDNPGANETVRNATGEFCPETIGWHTPLRPPDLEYTNAEESAQ